MPKQKTPIFNPQKLKILIELREDRDLKLKEVAKFFDMKDPDAIQHWEIGRSSPHPTKRLLFIYYLFDELLLRRNPQQFLSVWNDIAVEQWGWEELSDEELWIYFPGSAQLLTLRKRNIPFLAPPRLIYDLVGRDDLLYDLKQGLLAGGHLALYGLPGVGKTALAVALAHNHEVLAHFRDGILWARLGREGNVFEELGKWGIALGIPSQEMAKLTNLEDRKIAVGRAIGLRRMLLVIDDAWQVKSARDFQLGGANCAHLATTRLPHVAEDFAGKGAVGVPELSEADGLMLLGQLAPRVIKSEPDKASELVRVVGSLPLALLLMGAYLRKKTRSGKQRRILQALEQLQQTEQRLQLEEDQLPGQLHPSLPEGATISLEAIIAVSDEALDDTSRRALRALSVLPPKPNTFSETAALTIAGESVETIDNLSDLRLLEINELDRYTLHQTIAGYARVKLTDTGAFVRMVEFFVDYIGTHATDYAALDLESDNVQASLQVVFDMGLQEALIQGANSFFHYLEAKGLYELAGHYLNQAQQAARSLNDQLGLVTTLSNLGRLAEKKGDYPQAEKNCQEGLDLAWQIGHQESICALLQVLGVVADHSGNYARAEELYQESLTLARQLGLYKRIIPLLLNLGAVTNDLGNYNLAEEYLEEGVKLAREQGDDENFSSLLQNLAVVANSRGDSHREEQLYREALAVARRIEHRENIIYLLTNLGALAYDRGDLKQADANFQEGLELAEKIRHPERISALWGRLGMVAHKYKSYDLAEEYFQRGLDMARQIGHSRNIIACLTGLGELATNLGNYPLAEEYLQEAIGLDRPGEDRWYITEILCKWGELYLKQQKLNLANTAFRKALEMATEANIQEQIGNALFGLSRVAAMQGSSDEAVRLAQESLSIFEKIGHYKATEVKQWLESLPMDKGSKDQTL